MIERKEATKSRPNRILYHQNNSADQVTLVCIGSIHGNEPAGVKGLQNVIAQIEENDIKFQGNFYALVGNIRALNKQKRFLDFDLNRVWTKERINDLKASHCYTKSEDKEQFELYNDLKIILEAHHGKFVFIDLHTTSSYTLPFITISDSLNNRALARTFNLPIVLGIEEYLDGPLLTYMNEFGHTSLGFEAGQHNAEHSIVHCEGFVWLILLQLKMVQEDDFDYFKYKVIMNLKRGFYEIVHRQGLEEGNSFQMRLGFRNFDKIKKNDEMYKDSIYIMNITFSN